MQKQDKKNFMITGGLFILAALFTVLAKNVDVRPIAAGGQNVGFGGMNQWIHELLGVHMIFYTITDILGILTILTAVAFAFIGFLQLLQRKNLWEIDKHFFVLAAFYVLVFATYVFFEIFIINYRPILMDGEIEASYPSSHTMLAVCFLFAVIRECNILINNDQTNKMIKIASIVLMVAIVLGRLISGVHWFTDIIGGVLISSVLCMLYHSVLCMVQVDSLD